MSEAPINPGSRGGRAVALFLLLPSLVLAWPGPGSVLRDVFDATELTATAAALLAALPLALFALFRGGTSRPRYFALWLPCIALALLGDVVPGWKLSDTLEASRGQWALYLAAIATWAGAAAGPEARLAFLRGSMLVSLTFTLYALATVSLGGILGNTGELASAALFGAVLGARAVLRERGAWRIVGGCAVLAFTAQAAAAPSIANVLAFLVGTLAWTLFEPGAPRERGLRLGVALLPLVCLFALQTISSSTTDSDQPQTEAVLGGVGVRASIGKATIEMIGDTPWLGVGPGQFVVEFPPYRRLEEIAASSDRADDRIYTEVEHPHQDELLVLAEYGLLAGGAWIAFWILAGLRALAFLRKGDSSEVALALGCLAVLVGSLANSSLVMNPAALVPAFVAMGMLLSAKLAENSNKLLRFALPAALVLLWFQSAPRAWNALRHGKAIASLARIEGNNEGDSAALTSALDAALEACPDSVVARSLSARIAGASETEMAKSLDEWSAVLALRPNRVEALLEASRQLALLDEYDAADDLTSRALELDSQHPTALRNLTRFRFYGGKFAAARESLAALQTRGLFDEEFALSLASRLLLGGQAREGQYVLERISPDWASLTGDDAWVEAGKRKNAGDARLADAFQSYAHWLWARELVLAGNYDRAIAAYRQNLRITRDYVADGPVRVRMEFVAALWLDGRKESAAELAQALRPRASDWASLPDWAGEALQASGLFP